MLDVSTSPTPHQHWSSEFRQPLFNQRGLVWAVRPGGSPEMRPVLSRSISQTRNGGCIRTVRRGTET